MQSNNIYTDIMTNNPVLSRKEEYLLFKIVSKYKTGKKRERAREQLILANLRLVKKEALYYSKHSCVDIQDLMNAGCEGLCIAIDRFDINYATKLSTYALPWIKLMIFKTIKKYNATVYIPVHIINKLLSFNKNKNNVEEIMSAKELFDIKISQPTFISLNSHVSNTDNDGECTVANIIPDNKAIIPGIKMDKADIREILIKEVQKLDKVSIDILNLRYLSDEKENLFKIGKKYNLSGERIRQIEFKARKILRRRLEKYHCFRKQNHV